MWMQRSVSDHFMFWNEDNIGFAQLSKWKRQIVRSSVAKWMSNGGTWHRCRCDASICWWCNNILQYSEFRNIQKYWHDRCDASICWCCCNIQGKNNVLPVFGVLINAWQKYWNHLYCRHWIPAKHKLKKKNERSAALVEEVAIVSCQNHQYCGKYFFRIFLQYWSCLFHLQYCGKYFLRIFLQYCSCLLHLSHKPALLLLCVFWQMQLLRFSYFSKFKYYIDVLKYSEEVSLFAAPGLDVLYDRHQVDSCYFSYLDWLMSFKVYYI